MLTPTAFAPRDYRNRSRNPNPNLKESNLTLILPKFDPARDHQVIV